MMLAGCLADKIFWPNTYIRVLGSVRLELGIRLYAGLSSEVDSVV